MNRAKISTTAALLALTTATTMLPLAAHADTQGNKNTWRNLAIGSAAVGGYGLLKHNTTLGVIGVAGAAYSANRYEQDRHHQSQARAAARARYYHRHHHYKK